MKKTVYTVCGLSSVGLGMLGSVVPGLPSTCFFILAVYFFSKSSKRLEYWVLEKSKFGPSVKAWQQYRALTYSTKIVACAGISFGILMIAILPINIYVKIGLISFNIGSAIYLITRPTLRMTQIK